MGSRKCNRVKDNLGPSESSKCLDALISSGKKFYTTGNPFEVINETENQDDKTISSTDENDELHILVRGFHKKDNRTLTKSLDSLYDMCVVHRDTPEHCLFLTKLHRHFPFIYDKFCSSMNNHAKKIVGKILLEFVEYDRKSLSKMLKNILSNWFAYMFDRDTSVSEISRNSFTLCFNSGEKKEKLTELYADKFRCYLEKTLDCKWIALDSITTDLPEHDVVIQRICTTIGMMSHIIQVGKFGLFEEQFKRIFNSNFINLSMGANDGSINFLLYEMFANLMMHTCGSVFDEKEGGLYLDTAKVLFNHLFMEETHLSSVNPIISLLVTSCNLDCKGMEANLFVKQIVDGFMVWFSKGFNCISFDLLSYSHLVLEELPEWVDKDILADCICKGFRAFQSNVKINHIGNQDRFVESFKNIWKVLFKKNGNDTAIHTRYLDASLDFIYAITIETSHDIYADVLLDRFITFFYTQMDDMIDIKYLEKFFFQVNEVLLMDSMHIHQKWYQIMVSKLPLMFDSVKNPDGVSLWLQTVFESWLSFDSFPVDNSDLLYSLLLYLNDVPKDLIPMLHNRCTVENLGVTGKIFLFASRRLRCDLVHLLSDFGVPYTFIIRLMNCMDESCEVDLTSVFYFLLSDDDSIKNLEINEISLFIQRWFVPEGNLSNDICRWLENTLYNTVHNILADEGLRNEQSYMPSNSFLSLVANIDVLGFREYDVVFYINLYFLYAYLDNNGGQLMKSTDRGCTSGTEESENIDKICKFVHRSVSMINTNNRVSKMSSLANAVRSILREMSTLEFDVMFRLLRSLTDFEYMTGKYTYKDVEFDKCNTGEMNHYVVSLSLRSDLYQIARNGQSIGKTELSMSRVGDGLLTNIEFLGMLFCCEKETDFLKSLIEPLLFSSDSKSCKSALYFIIQLECVVSYLNVSKEADFCFYQNDVAGRLKKVLDEIYKSLVNLGNEDLDAPLFLKIGDIEQNLADLTTRIEKTTTKMRLCYHACEILYRNTDYVLKHPSTLLSTLFKTFRVRFLFPEDIFRKDSFDDDGRIQDQIRVFTVVFGNCEDLEQDMDLLAEIVEKTIASLTSEKTLKNSFYWFVALVNMFISKHHNTLCNGAVVVCKKLLHLGTILLDFFLEKYDDVYKEDMVVRTVVLSEVCCFLSLMVKLGLRDAHLCSGYGRLVFGQLVSMASSPDFSVAQVRLSLLGSLFYLRNTDMVFRNKEIECLFDDSVLSGFQRDCDMYSYLLEWNVGKTTVSLYEDHVRTGVENISNRHFWNFIIESQNLNKTLLSPVLEMISTDRSSSLDERHRISCLLSWLSVIQLKLSNPENMYVVEYLTVLFSDDLYYRIDSFITLFWNIFDDYGQEDNEPLFDKFDFANPNSMELYLDNGKDGMKMLCIFIYYHLLLFFPSTIKMWWIGNKSPNSPAARIKAFTVRYFADHLVDWEMKKIADARKSNVFQPMKVVTMWSKLEQSITGRISIEGKVIEIKIIIPTDYPFEQLRVISGKRIGVSENVWRSWLLSTQKVLFLNNTSLFRFINVWKNNMLKRFQGVDECVVCYSILQPVDNSLPTKPCQVCHNKFHSACIYKWIKTSEHGTCPLCRSVLFI